MWNSHEERQLDRTCLTPGRDKDGTANAFGWPPADAPDGLRPPAARPLFVAPHWLVLSILLAIWALAFASIVSGGFVSGPAALLHNWPLALVLHLPYLLLLCFLGFGLLERFGFLLNRHKAVPMGVIDGAYPKVCIQIPMFNEGAVARRIIEAAARIDWPRDRLEIQVLDDSTDADTLAQVEATCSEVQQRAGVRVAFIHRTVRSGYKAGALEAGRRQSDAAFIAIFDADFLPAPDYLKRTIPHFFTPSGRQIERLALVQAQWGHLNDDESLLTAAQALWVDDHHSLQQSWRSTALDFVNFTGTAGVWRAAALEAAGGWSSSSLVEDCEISFRALFAGYRTKIVRDVVVPAELPQSLAAYRSQQKRWTQGWAQLQRLHLSRLLFRFGMPLRRKLCLVHMMCISWQWPLWMLWIAVFPFLIAKGLALSVFGPAFALLVYFAPPLAFALVAAFLSTRESRATYRDRASVGRFGKSRRFLRVVPNLVLNAGLITHHVCAFAEGLFGPMHAEFERTPKTASVTTAAAPEGATIGPSTSAGRRPSGRPAYLIAELGFLAAQASWAIVFALEGLLLAALGAVWLVAGIVVLRIAPLVHGLRHRWLARKGRELASC